MTRLAETLLWLCSIPSPIGDEKALCDAVEKRLGGRVFRIRRIGHSLVATVREGTKGAKIALVGHLDVVRTEHDGAPRIDGDRLFGPGAADMKSGLAAMLELLETGVAGRLGV